ncbi:MAG: hypothetical protein KF712_17225 [Akkermansiaceae bacterium]|nr:hypothetical protein [Akkermansiaceae bacterium]
MHPLPSVVGLPPTLVADTPDLLKSRDRGWFTQPSWRSHAATGGRENASGDPAGVSK